MIYLYFLGLSSRFEALAKGNATKKMVKSAGEKGGNILNAKRKAAQKAKLDQLRKGADAKVC